MKKILYTALLALAATGLGACTTEVEDVFDTPASERIEQKTLECKTLLTSAEYGWMIEYYPDSQQSYGGSTYAAKFDADGNVTLTGQIAVKISGDITKTVTSHYSINASSSVLLTFDTYNEYLHYWSDPDFTSGNDFDGDFEFAYVSGNEQEMIFRGIKTGNKIVFSALEKDIVASAQAIADIENLVVPKLYYGYNWSESAPAFPQSDEAAPAENVAVLYADDRNNLLTYYPDGDTEGAYETYPYAFTSEGIRFYAPVTIDGITAQEFEWLDDCDYFQSIDAKDASGTDKIVILSGFQAAEFMHYDAFVGNYQAVYYHSSAKGNVRAPLTLEVKERYQTFTLKGLDGLREGYDIEVEYSKSGKLKLKMQYLGPVDLTDGNTYALYLLPMTATGGTMNADAGFDLIHNGDPDNLVLTFQDNGALGADRVTGFMYYAMNAGWIFYVDNLTTMTKL